MEAKVEPEPAPVVEAEPAPAEDPAFMLPSFVTAQYRKPEEKPKREKPKGKGRARPLTDDEPEADPNPFQVAVAAEVEQSMKGYRHDDPVTAAALPYKQRDAEKKIATKQKRIETKLESELEGFFKPRHHLRR